MEEANFARIRGSMARQQAKMAQINTIAQTGTSLMSMGGSSGGDQQEAMEIEELVCLVMVGELVINNA